MFPYMCAYMYRFNCDYGSMFLYMCVSMYIFVTIVPCFCTCMCSHVHMHIYLRLCMVPYFFSDPLQHKERTRPGGCHSHPSLCSTSLVDTTVPCTIVYYHVCISLISVECTVLHEGNKESDV